MLNKVVAALLLSSPAALAVPVSHAHVLDVAPVDHTAHKSLRLSNAMKTGAIQTQQVVLNQQPLTVNVFTAPTPASGVTHCSESIINAFDTALNDQHCEDAFRQASGDSPDIDMDVMCPCVELLDAVEGIEMPNCTPHAGISITIAQMDLACIERDATQVNFMQASRLANVTIDQAPPSPPTANTLISVTTDNEKIVLDERAESQLRLSAQQESTGAGVVSYALSMADEARSTSPMLLAADGLESDSDQVATTALYIRGYKGSVAPHYNPDELFDMPAHGAMLREEGLLPKWFTDLEAESQMHTASSHTAVASLSSGSPAQLAVQARSKRNGRSIKSRIMSKFYQQTYDVAVDQATQAARNAYLATVPPSAKSPRCQALKLEFDKMEDHFKYFVDTPQEQIDEKGNYAVEKMDQLLDLEAKLHGFTGALLVLKVVTTICGLLPYVGPAFKVLGRALGVVKNVLQRFYDQIKAFNNNFTDRIKPKVEDVVDKNVALAEKIEEAKFMLLEYGVKPTLITDYVCSTVTEQTVCRPEVTAAVSTANHHIQNVRNEIDAALALITIPYDMLKLFVDQIFSAAWNTFSNIMSAITSILQPFINLIDVTICFPLPQVRWSRECANIPCGLSCGWGGCSVNYCHVCVSVPIPYFRDMCFSVRSIIEGITGAISLVMDGLMSILENMIPGMPSISIPGLSFPSLPSIPNLWGLINLNFPTLNFPSLGFPCLPAHGFISAHHGKLSIAAPFCSGGSSHGGCFSLPGMPDFGTCALTCPMQAGGLGVSGTGCEMSGSCVQSKNYNGNHDYGNNQACTIITAPNQHVTAAAFSTEAGYDKVTINGHAFSGSSGPNNYNVGPSGQFTWASDYSVSRGYWRVCAA